LAKIGHAAQSSSDSHRIKIGNRFLSAVMRDPSPASGKPEPFVFDLIVYKDVAWLGVLPLLARLAATHLDVGSEMFGHPSAFVVCGFLD
jgi:hypothetical protein